MHTLRKRLKSGEPVIGSWINTASPIVAELMAAAGRATEVGGRRAEDGGQRSEVGGQRSEDGGRRSEGGGRRSAEPG